MGIQTRSFRHSQCGIKIILLCLLFSSSASAHQKEAQSAAPALVDIATEYQTTVTSADDPTPSFSDNFHFWRYGKFIEVLKADKKIGERWELLRNEQLLYTWSSHPDKFSVLHTNTSLSIIGKNIHWENKATLIERSLLSHLEKTGDEIYLDTPAERYRGLVNGVDTEVLWIESLQIPASVVQTYLGQVTRLQLKAVYPFTDAPWQPVDTNVYFEVDYTDIGDHEAEPLIQKYIRMISNKDEATATHQH